MLKKILFSRNSWKSSMLRKKIILKQKMQNTIKITIKAEKSLMIWTSILIKC